MYGSSVRFGGSFGQSFFSEDNMNMLLVKCQDFQSRVDSGTEEGVHRYSPSWFDFRRKAEILRVNLWQR